MIEQNKKNSLYYVMLLFVMFISIFSICNLVYADIPPYQLNNNSNYFCTYSRGTNIPAYDAYINNVESTEPVYICTYGNFYNGSTYSGSNYGFLVVSSSEFTYQWNYDNSTENKTSRLNNGYYIYTSYISSYISSTSQSLIVNQDIPYYTDYETAFTVVTEYIESGGQSAGDAVILNTQSSIYLGTSRNESVYAKSSYENDAAVALCSAEESTIGGSYLICVSKNNYGVFVTKGGVESSLLSNEIIVDGVTWYSKYDTSLVIDDPALTPFSSENDAIQACIDLIKASYPSDGRRNVLYEMPGGNMAYILPSEYTESILLQINVNNSVSANKFSSLGIKYGWASSLPDGSLPSSDSLNSVSWTPVGSTNIIGQYSSAQCVIDVTGHTNDYLIVYNPFQSDFVGSVVNDGAFQTTINPGVIINATNIRQMKVYGVTQSLNTSTGVISETPSGDEWTLDQNSNDNTFVDNSGNTGSPLQGGGGNTNPVENFWQWLNGQFESLKNLFATGHNTIQTLVGYGSDFMNSVQKLYEWLPPAVYSVLQAALILVIIIGVVKVFL